MKKSRYNSTGNNDGLIIGEANKQPKKAPEDENYHEGHRERMRGKFQSGGFDKFEDHEILEFLLFFTVTRANTNIIGHRLLDTFGSISGVFDAPIELLCKVEGVGPKSALLIKAVSSTIKVYLDDSSLRTPQTGCTRARLNIIKTPEHAKQFMRNKFWGEQKECIYMAFMGNNGKILYCKKIAIGTPDNVSIVPADILRLALTANAKSAVIAHNHPHGISNPSTQDLRTTSILFDELQRVGVELLDHIIVAPNEAPDDAYSMKQHNMFPSHNFIK